jgi:hypothetical protein
MEILRGFEVQGTPGSDRSLLALSLGLDYHEIQFSI